MLHPETRTVGCMVDTTRMQGVGPISFANSLDRLAIAKRPPHMRAATYARIVSELEPIKAEINRRVAMKMARAKGPLGGWGALIRWGL